MFKLLIIDDEADAIRLLRKFLETIPEVEIIGDANSVQSGIKAIETLQPDGILLDIRMKDGTGFDILNHFHPPAFNVIFTTAYDDFAIKAFEYNAVDYILKPVIPEQLEKAIQKAIATKLPDWYKQFALLSSAFKDGKLEKITVHTNEGIECVKIDEIIRLESENNYTTFFLSSGEKIVISKTLKDYEDLLPNKSFFRTHQSHLIHIKHVKKFLKKDGGYALMLDGSLIPISRRKKEKFLELLLAQS